MVHIWTAEFCTSESVADSSVEIRPPLASGHPVSYSWHLTGCMLIGPDLDQCLSYTAVYHYLTECDASSLPCPKTLEITARLSLDRGQSEQTKMDIFKLNYPHQYSRGL